MKQEIAEQTSAGLPAEDGAERELMIAIRGVTKDEICAAAQKLSLDTVYFLKGAIQ